MGLALYLPPWNPADSDGCSVPCWLRWIFPLENEAQQEACRRHDRAYYYGGTAQQRYIADLRLERELLDSGFSRMRAYSYFVAVRIFGHPLWRWNPQRWGFGGARYKYTLS